MPFESLLCICAYVCVYVIENVLVYKNENRNLPKTSREKETTTV